MGKCLRWGVFECEWVIVGFTRNKKVVCSALEAFPGIRSRADATFSTVYYFQKKNNGQ